MIQEKINYDEIMSLGFNEEIVDDKVYEAEHGYSYAIIHKDLTKRIYLEWWKDTKLCDMVRMDSPKKCNVLKRMPIRNLEHLKEIINFFSDEQEQTLDERFTNI